MDGRANRITNHITTWFLPQFFHFVVCRIFFAHLTCVSTRSCSTKHPQIGNQGRIACLGYRSSKLARAGCSEEQTFNPRIKSQQKQIGLCEIESQSGLCFKVLSQPGSHTMRSCLRQTNKTKALINLSLQHGKGPHLLISPFLQCCGLNRSPSTH